MVSGDRVSKRMFVSFVDSRQRARRSVRTMNNLLVSCREQESAFLAEITGTVPDWLDVELLRIGPAQWDFVGSKEKFSLNHWLDGSAMLCKISVSNGEVMFRSKFLQTDAYKRVTAVGKPVFTEFGTRAFADPGKNMFSRFLSQIVPSDLTDNAAVGIFSLADQFYACSETCNISRICENNMDVRQKINLDKNIGVNLACAHVQHIQGEDYAYNMGSSFITGMKYHLLKIPVFKDDSGEKQDSYLSQAKIHATISSSWTTCIAYYHSWGLTPNYVVFCELPMLVNGFKLATATPKGKPLKDCFEWHPNEPARFYLICKQSGSVVRKFYAPAFFYFHTINTFEEDGHVVMDVLAYENAEILDKWSLDRLRSNVYDDDNQATPTRFVFPLDGDTVTLANTTATAEKRSSGQIFLIPEVIGPAGFELPTINYRQFNGHKYRYCYGSGVFEVGRFQNALCKIDFDAQDESSRMKRWFESDDLFPGECIFVPRPEAVDEDDGVLLSVVLSSKPDRKHFVLMLDAKTFHEIGRAHLMSGIGQIPPTIHGIFRYKNTRK